jgi:hypothetical protein
MHLGKVDLGSRGLKDSFSSSGGTGCDRGPVMHQQPMQDVCVRLYPATANSPPQLPPLLQPRGRPQPPCTLPTLTSTWITALSQTQPPSPTAGGGGIRRGGTPARNIVAVRRQWRERLQEYRERDLQRAPLSSAVLTNTRRRVAQEQPGKLNTETSQSFFAPPIPATASYLTWKGQW